ncbi:hypothetical protein G5C65_30465, partial [Streptomyces sp. SB3404]|nr:hypothetical protein [Streptomyces boncukensis]
MLAATPPHGPSPRRFEPRAYVVDESTARESPSEPAWTGRVQRVLSDGSYLLITETGYQWRAGARDVRAATDAERAVYEAKLARLKRERAALTERLSGRG